MRSLSKRKLHSKLTIRGDLGGDFGLSDKVTVVEGESMDPISSLGGVSTSFYDHDGSNYTMNCVMTLFHRIVTYLNHPTLLPPNHNIFDAHYLSEIIKIKSFSNIRTKME